MFRFFALILSAAVFGLASLTIVKAPDPVPWKLAIVAGEYGHWLAQVALVLGFAVVAQAIVRGGCRVGGGVSVAAALLAFGAVGLFYRPLLSAWRLAKVLPERLGEELGAGDPGRRPLDSHRLYRFASVPRAEVETRTFAREGTMEALAMDVYRTIGDVPAPCVIVVHGGGWDGGDRHELAEVNHWLASRGYVVAAIDYRLAPEAVWPAQAEDVEAAIGYLKAHAGEFGIDAKRLVLFGRSAGGQLATAVAYTRRDPAVRGVVSFYGPQDMIFAWDNSKPGDVLDPLKLLRQYLGGTPEEAEAAYRGASAYFHVGPDVPPTLLVHGKLDTLVWHRQSARLDAKLTEAGVKHAFVSLPWATHACEFNLNGPSGQLATYALEWFLRSVTGPTPSPAPTGDESGDTAVEATPVEGK